MTDWPTNEAPSEFDIAVETTPAPTREPDDTDVIVELFQEIAGPFEISPEQRERLEILLFGNQVRYAGEGIRYFLMSVPPSFRIAALQRHVFGPCDRSFREAAKQSGVSYVTLCKQTAAIAKRLKVTPEPLLTGNAPRKNKHKSMI